MDDSHYIAQAIRREQESQRVEYKRSAPWVELKRKIIQTALAMANVRDGGLIIVGMEETDGKFSPTGMNDDDLSTYKADDIQAAINSYADPPISVLWSTEVLDEKTFGILVIQEFDQIPVLCRKDGEGLNEGALYFRSSRMPETAKVRNHADLRDILERAIDRGVRAFVQRARYAGLELGHDEGSDEAMFDRQRKGI